MAGPDEVVVEMPIASQEDGVDLLWKLFNKIYETGKYPLKCSSLFSLPSLENLTLWNVKTTELRV